MLVEKQENVGALQDYGGSRSSRRSGFIADSSPLATLRPVKRRRKRRGDEGEGRQTPGAARGVRPGRQLRRDDQPDREEPRADDPETQHSVHTRRRPEGLRP